MMEKPLKRLIGSLTKENLWLYVLSILRRKKVYAYGLREEINKEFGWKPGLITSYIVLYKLEMERLISSEFEGRRKYYKITEDGEKLLEKAKEYIKEVESKLFE